MPKRVFWPVALVIMGLIVMAAQLKLLPPSLEPFWPVLIIIVGLGGLLISDREEWSTPDTVAKAHGRQSAPARKTTRAPAKAKKTKRRR